MTTLEIAGRLETVAGSLNGLVNDLRRADHE